MLINISQYCTLTQAIIIYNYIYHIAGYPPIIGDDILQKRRYAREQLDHLRVLLMSEPRGHADMYGALLVNPDLSEAHMAVLFTHNEGK